MTQLLAILALTSAWIHNITPESCIVPFHMFGSPVSLHVYLSFVYQILSLLHWLQHCCEEYSSDTVQMNTWKASYAYNIAISTPNLDAVCWYIELSWIYVCPPSEYTTYGDCWFSWIDSKLSLTPCNSAVTYWVLQILNDVPILCHAVTSNARAFTPNYCI